MSVPVRETAPDRELVIDAGFVQRELARTRSRRLEPLQRAGLPRPTGGRTTWIGDLQQGDGGKGAMTDRLAAHHDVVVRVQGGDNAGHTTVFSDGAGGDVVLKNHILPSGLRHPGVIGILANGVLVNAERLAQELAEFSPSMPGLESRLFISGRAHMILPLHIMVDERQEIARSRSGTAIGTTKRGIGPANVAKVNRIGLRVHDLHDLRVVQERIDAAVEFFGLPEEETQRNMDWVLAHRPALLAREVDSARLLRDLVAEGHTVLFEGAQGPLIDLEHGIYPFVTTSPTAVHSVGAGAGFDLADVDHRIGVLKVYQTMVGNGAFVSEDLSHTGARLRVDGDEFGTTTGRDRRCGWLDLVQARWAIEVNGFTSIVLTKLDVLDGFDTIGLCVAYERDGELLVEFDAENEALERCTPVFRYFPGWLSSTSGLDSYEELPVNARKLIEFVSSQLRTDISGVTVGPRDSDMLLRHGSPLDEIMGR
jgi:adenylosuccinate synthase